AADISVVGAFKSTLVPWMKDEIKKGIDDLRASAKAKFDADLKALKEAEKKVDELNEKIRKLKEEDQKAKDRADEALNSAIRRVNSLRSTYDHQDHEAHHCGSRWTHWACAPGWRIAASATWTVMKVAEGALEAAKKAVAAATNLDPRVAALIAERDIEHAALSVAEAVVKVTEAVEDFVMKELEKILEATVSHLPLEIDETVIVGDLRGMILRNEPMVLDMKFRLAGAPMREYFAVKVPDRPENLEFDAKAFALLPVLALDQLTEAPLKKISPDAAKWVHSHIATKLAAAQEEVRKQVEAQEARYRKVLDSFENGSAKYRKAFEDQSEEHRRLVEELEVTDLMPDSLQYANTYLAIGHSNLCLAVSKDGISVEQIHCKDIETEQWNTAALKDDDAGYVELRNKGLCLKARKGDSADNYEPLVLAACDAKDRHQQWKIVSSDGFYDQIVNRFSQKCLHFDNESANPRSAFAVWTSCLGADSQTFRDIPDAEKPTPHNVNAFVKASNGLCLDVLEETEGALKLTVQNKEARLYAHPCGDKSERFNYIEEVDGDIRLVHTETGACVYPAEKSQHLALRACDRGQDMFWRLNAEDKDTLQFFSPARNSCMILPAPDKGSDNYKEAGTAPCNTTDGAQLLDLVK
ncbi:MAG TPA: RICIN domain-containing protein, partial [Elusimicrobiales bacterium]|nr:RICIN domain-containing protein [Elusimicrobiales bacterium]